MTALLPEVQDSAERLAETLSVPGPRQMQVVGGSGAGKAALLRQAGQLSDRNVVFLEASADDNLTPMALMDGLVGGLAAAGYPLPATDDAERDAWSDRVSRCESVLDRLGEGAPIVLLAGVERLERVAASGGAPGRHATDFSRILRRNVPNLVVSRAAATPEREDTVTIDRSDLRKWLTDEAAWGPLAPAAAAVAARGAEWSRLPALTLRLLVAMAHLDALPAAPPSTPLEAGRALAVEMAPRRATRLTWAAWQLIARVRGPLDDPALAMLLSGLPTSTEARDLAQGPLNGDELLTRCLLFRHQDWQMHPSLREVIRNPPAMVRGRMLPQGLVRDTGRRTYEHFRIESLRLQAEGDTLRASVARTAALDACAMAGDDALVGRVDEELPDPYDHVGAMTAEDPARSRPAYRQARLIDADDATALRGLADAEDREGSDAPAVEQLLRRVLVLEPRDLASRVRLVGVLLAAGKPQAARTAFDDATSALAGVLDEGELARRLYVPVARLAVSAGGLPLASRAAAIACDALDVEEIADLDRLVAGLVEALEYGEFVTTRRLGTQWWTSPELLPAFDSERTLLSRWLAARIDKVEQGVVSLHYADVILPARSDRRPDRAWTTLALTDLRGLSVDVLPDRLPGTILEIGVYGDGSEQGSTIVRVPKQGSIEIPEPALPLDRYVNRTT